ncbi:CPBP family intramembrane glutamic endopeptidase [Occallatibacter riparius]|uniref:CPBP family intramembrane metalloprotease n=1 Tax=Occallatibacter riparius TaxID=1002689 RepID=A0A9J7BKQ5_9BACT|nr:CPBP family intramembrane glutamic endopeptidase [Occallatibacter riparius]UWZ82354.1 CPBP family intramembrane metalloprotease [Occallatibacter riparius]
MSSQVASGRTHAPSGRARITAQLVTFFTASFLLAWAAWIPVIKRPSLPSQLAFIGLFAPALAGLLTAALFGGAPAVRQVMRRLRIVAFPLRWALLAAFIMPAIYFAAVLALRASRSAGTGALFIGNSPLFILAAFLWLLFVNAGEEIGWRGFALPQLLALYNRPVLVSLALGLIWGIWHMPLYLLPGQSAFPFPLFLIFTCVQSVLYALLFLRTKGSLLPALLLHAGTDIAPRIFQLTLVPPAFWMVVDGLLAVVVTVLVVALRDQRVPLSQSHEDVEGRS